MLSDLFRGPGLIVILIIVLLLFGAPRLPALARSVAQSMKIFRSEVKGPEADEVTDADDEPTPPVAKAKSAAQRTVSSSTSASKSTPPKPKK